MKKHRQRKSVDTAGRPAAHAIALAALSFAVYATALGNGFVSDDNFQLLNNPLVRDWRRIPQILSHSVWAFAGAANTNYYRPVQILGYMSVYYLFGFDPRAYHLAMLLAHVAATLLVYLLGRRWLGGWQGALVAAAVFAIHPIHTEAVIWVAAVPDALVTVLVLTGLYWFAREDGRPRLSHAAGLAALYLAAMMTKETGAMLLVLLAACEVLLMRRRIRDLSANAVLYGLLCGTLAVYVALRYHALGALAPAQGVYVRLPHSEYFFSVVFLAGKYLWKLLLPAGLNYYHEFDPVRGPGLLWALAMLACLALVAGMVYFRFKPPTQPRATAAASGEKQSSSPGPWLAAQTSPAPAPLRPPRTALRSGDPGRSRLYSPAGAAADPGGSASFFLFLIAATLAPALNITGVGPNPFAERYLYLPSAGFVFLLGLVWERFVPKLAGGARAAAWGAAFLVLAAGCAQVLARTPVWHDDFSLFRHTAEQSPRAAFIRGNLGWWQLQRGNVDAAMAEYQAALRSDPNSALLHNNMGNALAAKREYAQAIQEIRRAIELNPEYAEARLNLGLALEATGDPAAAEAAYQQALRIRPAYPQALTALGLLQATRKDFDGAIQRYRRAIAANEDYAEAHINLGAALSELRRYPEAAAELRRAIELAPGHAQAHVMHYNLGVVYRDMGMPELAAGEFRRALQLRPDFELARNELARIQLPR
jgi:tetratricopeptide (TPR) repeat protein